MRPLDRADATTNATPVGAKGIIVSDGSLLTTDPVRAPFAGSAGDITVRAMTGVALIVRADTVLDAGRNVVLSTRWTGEGACLAGRVTLEGANGHGYIDLLRVRDAIQDDGTTRFVGRVKGAEKIIAATCAPG